MKHLFYVVTQDGSEEGNELTTALGTVSARYEVNAILGLQLDKTREFCKWQVSSDNMQSRVEEMLVLSPDIRENYSIVVRLSCINAS